MEAVNREERERRVVDGDDSEVHRVSHETIRVAGGVIVLSALVVLAPAAPLSVYAAATVVWLFLLRLPARGALIAGLFLRVAASLREPLLSFDVYRYLWDGLVSAAGIHPYRYAPIDPALAGLRPEWFARINHPEIATIYPPYAQILFVLAGGSLLLWRAILLGLDLWTIAMLERRDRRVAFAYATAPLVLFEGFWSGHVEIAAVAFLLAAISSSSPLLFALAAGIKLTPLAALPPLLRDAPRRLRFAAIFAAAMLLPFALAGRIMPGLGEYATRWSFNSPLYQLARAVAAAVPFKDVWTRIKDPLHLEPVSDAVYRFLDPELLARAALALGLLVALAFILIRVRDTTAAVADSLAALLLFSPTIHPWYWLVVIPFALLSRRHLWLWLAAASPFSYLMYTPSHDIGEPSQTTVMFLCYSLPLMGWLASRSRHAHETDR